MEVKRLLASENVDDATADALINGEGYDTLASLTTLKGNEAFQLKEMFRLQNMGTAAKLFCAIQSACNAPAVIKPTMQNVVPLEVVEGELGDEFLVDDELDSQETNTDETGSKRKQKHSDVQKVHIML